MRLALPAPRLSDPATGPVTYPQAEVLQLTFEAALGPVDRGGLLPAGLAPTIPTLLTLLVVRVGDGPLGPFTFAQARVSCRSGVRARALVAASVVDGPGPAVDALARGWGIGTEAGEVVLDRRYDRVAAAVPAWGLTAELVDPAPISGSDVQYVVGLHPVVTVAGDERLVQVELDVAPQRAERGRPVVERYAGLPLVSESEPGARSGTSANGAAAEAVAMLRPTHPVAATIAVGALTLSKVRFLLRPDVAPHLGTEVLA